MTNTILDTPTGAGMDTKATDGTRTIGETDFPAAHEMEETEISAKGMINEIMIRIKTKVARIVRAETMGKGLIAGTGEDRGIGATKTVVVIVTAIGTETVAMTARMLLRWIVKLTTKSILRMRPRKIPRAPPFDPHRTRCCCKSGGPADQIGQ